MNIKLIIKIMKRNIILIGMVVGLVGWSCSKVETSQSQQLGLKAAVEQSTAAINSAISNISTTKGYQVLTASNGAISKDATATPFNDSITLALVEGIYDYKPGTIILHHNINYPYRLFAKTGTSEKMIVNLPQQLIFHPGYLHSHSFSDTTLKNDFTITASDYHLYYNSRNNLDYKLAADLTLSSAAIGSFNLAETSNSRSDQTNSAGYTFTDGYSISTTWQTGDTTTATFALLKDNSALLKETTLFIKTDSHRREKQYDLTIGNVEIKRGNTDSIQVYLDGVLQKTAGAKITDSTEVTGSICYKRDILITYDDGTKTTLSTLIGPALTELKTLFTSLHEMYFAENIVDYIAINIYYNSK
jgi:hypothetical protein